MIDISFVIALKEDKGARVFQGGASWNWSNTFVTPRAVSSDLEEHEGKGLWIVLEISKTCSLNKFSNEIQFVPKISSIQFQFYLVYPRELPFE